MDGLQHQSVMDWEQEDAAEVIEASVARKMRMKHTCP